MRQTTMLKHDRSHANHESHDTAIRAARSDSGARQSDGTRTWHPPCTGRHHRQMDARGPRRPLVEFLHGNRPILLVRRKHRRLDDGQHAVFLARTDHLYGTAHRPGAFRRRAYHYPPILTVRLPSSGKGGPDLLLHRMAAAHTQTAVRLGTRMAAVRNHTIRASHGTLLACEA